MNAGRLSANCLTLKIFFPEQEEDDEGKNEMKPKTQRLIDEVTTFFISISDSYHVGDYVAIIERWCRASEVAELPNQCE